MSYTWQRSILRPLSALSSSVMYKYFRNDKNIITQMNFYLVDSLIVFRLAIFAYMYLKAIQKIVPLLPPNQQNNVFIFITFGLFYTKQKH